MEENNRYETEYKRWAHVIVVSQLIIATAVFVIEIINNIILYVTRSQGYGPDTIIQKLFRYLFLTTAINYGLIVLSHIVVKYVNNEKNKRYFLMLFTTLICTDVAFSHYQFATTLAVFAIPLIISILYEDWNLSIFTFIVSILGQILAVSARAYDSSYNKDIGPEAAIAFSITVCMLIFSKIIYSTLATRRREMEEAIINAEHANATAEKMSLSFKMLETLAGTLDAKDKYTNGHSIRVANYSTILARELGWDEERIATLRYEALLHDIGKIGVPDVILNKPSKLSDTEFGLIKSHTLVGADILKSMVAVPNATLVAKFHHERYDGKGYPSNIKGEDIPLNARVVCIADSYDAMNSDRIYRPALTKDIIRKELIKGRGGQFDPALLDVFLKLFDENKLDNEDNHFIINDNEIENAYTMNVVIDKIISMKEHIDSISDFDAFYDKVNDIASKYNKSLEVLNISIISNECNEDIISKISKELLVAIKKNIRAADVYYQESTVQYKIILFDVDLDNVEIVQKRIQFDFDNNCEYSEVELEFDIK